MTEWELIEDLCSRSRLARRRDDPRGRRLGYRCPDFRTAHHLDGFPTADGRFRFKPDWAALGPHGHQMPKLPDHMPSATSRRRASPSGWSPHPARQFLNSSFTEMPTSVKREAPADRAAAPDDHGPLGLAAGDLVRLGNERGAVLVHAKRKGRPARRPRSSSRASGRTATGPTASASTSCSAPTRHRPTAVRRSTIRQSGWSR